MLQSCAARLTGSEIPSFADAEKTFPELQDRIAKTVAYLKPFNPSQFDGSAERIITMNIRRKPVTLDGKTYLLAFSLPNFFLIPPRQALECPSDGYKLASLRYDLCKLRAASVARASCSSFAIAA